MIFGAFHRFINGRGPQLVALAHAYFTWLTLFPKGEHRRWEAEVALPIEFGAKFIVLHACRRGIQKIVTKVAKPRKLWIKSGFNCANFSTTAWWHDVLRVPKS
jgi:hypothetical protein